MDKLGLYALDGVQSASAGRLTGYSVLTENDTAAVV